MLKNVLVLLACSLLAGCAGLRDALDPKPPEVSVAGVRVTELGFNHAILLLDLRIDNPNAVGVKVAGYDYRLAIGGRTALTGDQRQRVELEAGGRSSLEVPLRLDFGELAGALGGLAGRNEIDYEIELGLDAEIPVLGERRVSARTAGTLPLPRKPEIELRELRVSRFDFSGATVNAVFGITNPNVFAVALDRMDWNLALGGNDLFSGGTTAPLRLGPDGRGELTATFDLDTASMSRSLITLLSGSGKAGYELNAMLEATAGDDRLGSFEVPVSRSGTVSIR